ncbi:MAG: hypothetical protein U1F46_08225 [Marinagarivorans sp.]
MMNIVKATFWASLAYIIPPLWFLQSGWVEMHSQGSDTNDSGVVQGYVVFGLASISALICVVVFFPLIAKRLGTTFTSKKWVYHNIAAIASLAFFAAAIFELNAGHSSIIEGFMVAAVLTIPFAILFLILISPAMYVWLRIANRRR